jgi:hypothetical protein
MTKRSSDKLPVGSFFRVVAASSLLSLGSTLVACGGEAPRSTLGAPTAAPASSENVASTEPLAKQESAATTFGRVGSHGMVVTGSPSEAFLSHIPMFAAPHDVQVVIRGAFAPLNDSSPSLPESFSERLFTFVPDRMSLDALRLGSLNELRGTIFLGNFEAGGTPLPARVRFAVSRVVHQHVLDAGTAPPQPPRELTYLLFGSQKRTFAVHRITASPGFDEVLRVDLGGDAPPDADLANGLEAKVRGAPDAPSARLGAGSAVKTVRAGSRTFTVKSAAELSCLEGPEFSSPCN